MIRHPLNSAVGRTRPDINRVTDGIAASLRQFSVSARRSAEDNNNNNNNDDDSSRRPTGRQRSMAAVNELIRTVDSGISAAAGMSNQNTANAPPAAGRPQGPNVISLKNLPNGLAGIRRTASPGGPPPQFSANGGPRIIRGGFVGRGRGGGAGTGFPSRGGGGAGFPSRGGPRGPRGPRPGSDDRPRRARGGARGRGRGRGGKDGDEEEGGGRRRNKRLQNLQEGEGDIMENLKVKSYLEEKETGTTRNFTPTLTLNTLAGWGPAVATSSSPFGQGETVLRQARILGSGMAYHPQNLETPFEMTKRWRDGNGTFVPPSYEGQVWKVRVMKTRRFKAPDEVKTAVLEDALLGKYGDGPKYADITDTIGTLRSYVRRDGTWNADAERRIENKVRSLLEHSVGAAAPEASTTTAAKTPEVKP
ncbi:hypothetical protein Daesc_009497 [Daldinia eschscholtzii]|uniref:Uncharacterized protein n=1 Tax=Daldinia eschscholtzii TaxID=292717 RepID=A0AAX6MB46_9PEZI